MFIDNMQDLKDIKKYTCGSPNLCKFLENNGLSPVYHYKLGKERRGRTMWVFIMTPELSELLTKWTNNKPKNKID